MLCSVLDKWLILLGCVVRLGICIWVGVILCVFLFWFSFVVVVRLDSGFVMVDVNSNDIVMEMMIFNMNSCKICLCFWWIYLFSLFVVLSMIIILIVCLFCFSGVVMWNSFCFCVLNFEVIFVLRLSVLLIVVCVWDIVLVVVGLIV